MAQDIQAFRAKINDGLVYKYDKVVGTGVGTKWVNGQDTGRPALLVYVVSKDKGIHALSANSQLVPADLDGIETDVIEVGTLVKHAYSQRIRPIKPGYSASHHKVTAGTLGGIFQDRDRHIVALSNNHVFANEGDCQLGDLICQPGPADDPTANRIFTGWDDISNMSYFATLKDYCPLSFNTGKNEQDSAIARIHDHYIEQCMVAGDYPTGRTITAFGTPQIGMTVQKFGRTTGHTTGTILGMNSEFTVAYDHGSAAFIGCIVTTAMSRGGDSGSVLLDEQYQAVGLLFGGSDKVSIHIPFQTVANRYGLQPWVGTAATELQYWGRNWRREYTRTASLQPDFMILEAYANQHAYIETTLAQNFTGLELDIFTADDAGTAWGPGLALVYPGGVLKLNAYPLAGFGGSWGGHETTPAGSCQRFHWYKLRVHYTASAVLGEVLDPKTQQLYPILEVPLVALGGLPSAIRIGKTDPAGGPTDNTDPGVLGRSHYKNLILT